MRKLPPLPEETAAKEAWPLSKKRPSTVPFVVDRNISEHIVERHKQLAVAIEDEMETTAPRALTKTIELRRLLKLK